MLGEVYSKEPADGGKTKGTSTILPGANVLQSSPFSALLLILSTRSPWSALNPRLLMSPLLNHLNSPFFSLHPLSIYQQLPSFPAPKSVFSQLFCGKKKQTKQNSVCLLSQHILTLGLT